MSGYLEVENLHAGYGKKTLILKGISFSLNRGQILTIVGPNGCGKSTLLKAISAILPITAGEVRLAQKVVSSAKQGQKIMTESERAKEMSVSLTGKVNPEKMTCFEVAAMGRYPYTGKMGILREKDKAIVNDLLKRMKIEHYANRYFHQISDGQKQRVLIARALCQQPGLLILDEPTAYLDIRYKYEILDFLSELAQTEKLTVVMTLHETDLALKISDRILCMKEGTLRAYGKPEEIAEGKVLDEIFDLDEAIKRRWSVR